jgi:hypothetical protein
LKAPRVTTLFLAEYVAVTSVITMLISVKVIFKSACPLWFPLKVRKEHL